MGTISGYIRNGYMDEALSWFPVVSPEVVMLGTDFPMCATSHFRLHASSANMLAGIALESMFYGRNS